MTAWPCDKIPPGPIKAQFGLELITCTPRDKIYVVYPTGQPLHYSRIRSFKIPTIPLPITTSHITKHPLILFSSNFVSYFHNRMQVNNMQMYNTLNQLINGVPSDDPFL